MLRIELIKKISRQFGVEETDAGVFVDGIFESMVVAFGKGKKINIPEFGKFNVINKDIGCIRQKYVIFSPAKNFADLINKDFLNLEPTIINAYDVKKNEILKVREILPDENEGDFLYFEFDFTDENTIVGEREDDVILINSGTPTDTKETESLNIESKDSRTNYPVTSSVSSEVGESIFTETNSGLEEEVTGDIKQGQSIPEENVIKSASDDQTVYSDNSSGADLSEQTIKSEFTDKTEHELPNAEEQIAENKKAIEEVEQILPLSIRVNLKDDLNIDNIKEEIFDILVKREEIIRELNTYISGQEIKPTEVELNKTIELKPDKQESENILKESEISESKREAVIEDISKTEEDDTYLFEELEKRIKELNELSQKQEEIKKVDLKVPKNKEMQIFDRLIEETPVVIEETPVVIEETPVVIEETPIEEKGKEVFAEIIIHDTEQEPEYAYPKTLSDALDNIKSEGVIEHLETHDNTENTKSYDDIFRKSENQFVPQFSVEPEKSKAQGGFFKVFLYIFFIFLLTAFSFYIYKTMLTKSTDSQVADTVGFIKIDSVRALLKNVNDSLNKKDTSRLKSEDDFNQTESIELKNINDVIFREIGNKIFIQNKVFDDLNDANELEMRLKLNNLECRVEGATKIDNGLEYRVLVGPFKNMEEAMLYYEKHKAILNFIQIINPRKPTLLVF